MEGGGNVNQVFVEISLFCDISKQYFSEKFETKGPWRRDIPRLHTQGKKLHNLIQRIFDNAFSAILDELRNQFAHDFFANDTFYREPIAMIER